MKEELGVSILKLYGTDLFSEGQMLLHSDDLRAQMMLGPTTIIYMGD